MSCLGPLVEAQVPWVSDRVISHFRVRGFPPFRQKKGERMGHGVRTKTSGQRPSGRRRVNIGLSDESWMKHHLQKHLQSYEIIRFCTQADKTHTPPIYLFLKEIGIWREARSCGIWSLS